MTDPTPRPSPLGPPVRVTSPRPAPRPATFAVSQPIADGDLLVEFAATLVDLAAAPAQPSDPLPGSWFVTHGLGGPAAGTYTEVAWDAPIPEDEDGAPLPDALIEAMVRQVVVALYGSAWAFLYRPDQYADAVERHGLRLRERALITGVEVLS